MADGITLEPGVGGATLATDDVGGIHYQLIKPVFGALDSVTIVSDANPFPVYVKSIVPGVAATNLGKAEDAVHASGDTGVMALGVRSDIPTALAADGDYIPLITNDEGALWVHEIPNHIDSNNSSTATLLASATFTGVATEVLDGQNVAINIHTSHDSAVDGMKFQFSSDGSNWDIEHPFTYSATNGGRHFQFGAHAKWFRVVYINGGTGQTHFRLQTLIMHGTPITSIHRLGDSIEPDRSAQVVKAAIMAQGAGTGNFIPVDATAGGNLKVSVEEPWGSNSALACEGDVAHDAADAGNPVKQGAKAIAHGTNPTAVAAADRTDLYANRAGVPFVIGGHPNVQTIRANYTTAQTNTAIITVGGGLKIVVTKIAILADNANSVDVQARVGFAAATTPTGAGVVASHPGIAPGSGIIEGDGSGILGVGADGEDLRITSEVPTSGSIDVVVSYYTIES